MNVIAIFLKVHLELRDRSRLVIFTTPEFHRDHTGMFLDTRHFECSILGFSDIVFSFEDVVWVEW